LEIATHQQCCENALDEICQFSSTEQKDGDKKKQQEQNQQLGNVVQTSNAPDSLQEI